MELTEGALARILEGVIDGAWITDSEHDPGCFGGGHYCETHCPVHVQRLVGIPEIAAALRAALADPSADQFNRERLP